LVCPVQFGSFEWVSFPFEPAGDEVASFVHQRSLFDFSDLNLHLYFFKYLNLGP
jgi:hypothetical protein